jgi:hypothetical protein
MDNGINRFERKWVYHNNDHLSLINELIRSKLFFSFNYPKRSVNSIYFDDSINSSVIQNIEGNSKKKKVRVRWYGSPNHIINPILEIKYKKGYESKKEFLKIDELNNLKFPNLINLNIISATVNDTFRNDKIMYPMVTTNYEREYLISNNRKVRATVDYNLKSIYLKNHSQLDIVKNFSSCILELKYSTKLDNYVRESLDNITLRMSKNSKYINSIFEVPSFTS